MAVLENQNRTLIEELKVLKDIYCHKVEWPQTANGLRVRRSNSLQITVRVSWRIRFDSMSSICSHTPKYTKTTPLFPINLFRRHVPYCRHTTFYSIWPVVARVQRVLWGAPVAFPCCRQAAKECRRRKREYIRCLETRLTMLEAQNKKLMDELNYFKEMYGLKSSQ